MGSSDDNILGLVLTTDQCESFLTAQHFKYGVRREDKPEDMIYYVDHTYGGWTGQTKDHTTCAGYLPNAPDMCEDDNAVWRVVERHVFDWEWEDETLQQLVAETVLILREELDYDFQKLFGRFAALLRMEDEHLATLLKTSRPTVQRWKSGRSAPHPTAQRSVMEALVVRAKETLY